jgi:hypothetical protein
MTETEYKELLERIVAGANFIEKLSPTDPKRPAAMAKYDRLVEQTRTYTWQESS